MNNILTYCHTANIDAIKEALNYYPIHAFSMNPSIATKDLRAGTRRFSSL